MRGSTVPYIVKRVADLHVTLEGVRSLLQRLRGHPPRREPPLWAWQHNTHSCMHTQDQPHMFMALSFAISYHPKITC